MQFLTTTVADQVMVYRHYQFKYAKSTRMCPDSESEIDGVLFRIFLCSSSLQLQKSVNLVDLWARQELMFEKESSSESNLGGRSSLRRSNKG